MTTANGLAKSARRAFELLEFFAEWRRPATIKEICVSLGYPQSSTSTLMKTLVEAGYFDYDARTRMYAPGVRVGLVTSWIEQSIFSEFSLLRLMERMLVETGHTVIISAQRGIQVQYIHLLNATRPNHIAARIGGVRLLFRTAPGKALLTTKSPREVAALLNRTNAEHWTGAQLDPEQVRRDLERFRSLGYADSFDDGIPNFGAVAVLIPLPRGYEPLALSIGGPSPEIRRERDELVALLMKSIAPLRQMVARR